jgi:excinuclease ABC subunit A
VGDRLETGPALKIEKATRHNLKNLTVEIPLGRFVVVTGVSGSGKTTLMREVLLPALEANLKSEVSGLNSPVAKASERIEDEKPGDEETDGSSFPPQVSRLTGSEHLGRVVLVDQSALGKTPRSNPAVYIGAFEDIRELFAQSEAAQQRGYNASAFSFNSAQGQCERCRGAGFEKIEMQFLSDIFIRCPDCNGRRYRAHILEVKIRGKRREEARYEKAESGKRKAEIRQSFVTAAATSEWSIADMLDATVDEAIEFLAGFADSKPARRAAESLKLLQEVGLGYLRLGQPINTLSGGESQRLKLVSHLAEAAQSSAAAGAKRLQPKARRETRKAEIGQGLITSAATLFLFDEPTTGLHFDDVRVLLKVFQRLTDAGHSVVVIEHNLDVIKCADWVIDLGPDAGDQGGRLVAQGTPEQIAACAESHTGRHLKSVLKSTTKNKP